MANKIIFWKGYSKESRYETLDKINQIINRSGDVVDVKQFSDISMSLRIEVEEQKIEKLYLDLKNYIELDDFDILESSTNSERTIFLNISFSLGKGNIEVAVPYV
ncbi:hypothetical protein [Arenibacter sp. ARW7G5Y1]|uniref:hypothetical protein n=1 Tax=Arenibacter sp. ARW7G5Y1 TaxID=2135619 RepID=UPI000D7581D1|nr:hypothetical protein [Arenibacter sp. ARW7G5Y1]PXX25717.1 hypothetical protein C7972_111135 [Arenibacter sp. ARW7G5Y1]